MCRTLVRRGQPRPACSLFDLKRKDMEEEPTVVEINRGLLTPRSFHLCCLFSCHPIGEAMVGVTAENRLSILDLPGMDDESFSSVEHAAGLKKMAMQVDDCGPAVVSRVSPAAIRPSRLATSALSDGISKRVKTSIFDVVTPPVKKGSRSAEETSIGEAADALLAWVGHEQRCKILDGYGDLPHELRVKFLREAVSKMAGVGSILQCARVLRKADAWLRPRIGACHLFRMKPAVVMWFLHDHLVADDSKGHVSEYLRSGLVFAAEHLKFEIGVREDLVAGWAARPLHTPVPAVSATVRLVVEFLRAAADPARSVQEAYYLTAFAIKGLAALRGIDAQRSILKERTPLFFVAVAWNSKKKRAMPWSCPNEFLGYDIIGKVAEPWQGRDYLFMVVSGPRGCNLSDATGFGASMASASVLLRHFKFLAESVGMESSLVGKFRRHSWRHFIANITRIAEFSEGERAQAGRWANLENMPTRYAQEVENAAMMAIVLKVEVVVRDALARVPLAKWPWVGGWEHLSPVAAIRGGHEPGGAPLSCPLVIEDVESDDECSDMDEGDGGSASACDGQAILAAWDRLKAAKVAARVAVEGWHVEFVLRSISESSVGDCYASPPTGPRIRSRAALLSALRMELPVPTSAALEEAARRLAASAAGSAETSASHETAASAMIGTEATAMHGTEATAMIGPVNIGWNTRMAVPAESAPPAPDGGAVRRPRELANLSSGFGDGDTALGPMKSVRRTAP